MNNNISAKNNQPLNGTNISNTPNGFVPLNQSKVSSLKVDHPKFTPNQTSNGSTSSSLRPSLKPSKMPNFISNSSHPTSAQLQLLQRPQQQPIFTQREAELQRLLAQERARSEQRRENYSALKEEHLQLQAAYLAAQAETKTILEETIYFKEKKNVELEELLSKLEERTRTIERLERTLRDSEPEVVRLKLAAELEEPIRRLTKETDRLAKERDKALHEAALSKQQLDHSEREHLANLEKAHLAAEAEVNVVRREKEELRARLVEACRVPEVKRLVEAREENSRLQRKLESAQGALEEAEGAYRAIQAQVESLLVEEEQRERRHEVALKETAEILAAAKEESKTLRSKLTVKCAEVDDLKEEVAHLNRTIDRLRYETEQLKIRTEAEKETLRKSTEEEKGRLVDEVNKHKEEVKSLRQEIALSNEQCKALHQQLNSKDKEINEKVAIARSQEADKVLIVEEKREALEAALKVTNHEKQLLKAEMEKLRRQVDSVSSAKLALDRELVMLRAKVDTQAEAIEEYEKMRRQHAALHEELNRLRAEAYDLAAAKKELNRLLTNAQTEVNQAKEQLEKEKTSGEEAKVTSERWLAKVKLRAEEELSELRQRVATLERENTRLRVGPGLSQTSTAKDGLRQGQQGLNEYSRLRAKQYGKIANRLSILLEQLKVNFDEGETSESKNKQKEVTKKMMKNEGKNTIGNLQNNQTNTPSSSQLIHRELEAIQRKQAELEASLEQVELANHTVSTASNSNSSNFGDKKRWKVKLGD